MLDTLTIEGETFTYDAIRSGAYATTPMSPYTQHTLEFCNAWLNGQTQFTVHTSGSTGVPKPIQLGRTQMQQSALMTGKALGLTQGQRALVCLNTQYIAGIMMLVRGFELGLHMTIIPPSENPLKNLKETYSHPTPFDFVALVPMQVQAILKYPTGTPWLNDLQVVIIGGAPVNYALAKALKPLRPQVYVTYGMTETVSHIALRQINSSSRAEEYQLLPGVHMRQDKRGCIEIQSPTTCHQWITTNDLVQLTDATHFKWLGRADRVINTGGVKVQVETVEQAIDEVMTEQGIQRRFFVASLPDHRLGEQIIVVLEGTPLPQNRQQAILENTAGLLKKYEAPKSMHFVAEFAETPTAKIDRLHTIKHLRKP
ncbi:AMP-binding protein [Microscilla marina]|uniref:O-succinylbenzoic acid--CoA ligase n=1 Tax=Microscilla marina ATCC 23134 TaxID=313606 RepID=A1ZXX2_MICM2|nr:AMP-binding protein [Microscilla marina]EAY24801.1 O-succinylbenzoic acid--CoA ligase [Microscilla marina ATCC 23134]